MSEFYSEGKSLGQETVTPIFIKEMQKVYGNW